MRVGEAVRAALVQGMMRGLYRGWQGAGRNWSGIKETLSARVSRGSERRVEATLGSNTDSTTPQNRFLGCTRAQQTLYQPLCQRTNTNRTLWGEADAVSSSLQLFLARETRWKGKRRM
jgi:hypothetical protein